MTTARVALFGRTNASVVIRDTEATVGAVFGVNLVWPDGSLVTPEDFVGGGEAPSPSDTIVYWRLIQEVPPNVQQVAALSMAGFVRRDGDGSWAAAPITNPDLASADTSGLAEGSNLYFTTERAQDAVGDAIAAGTGDGVTLTYDDAGNAIDATNTDKGSVAVAAHAAEVDPHPQYTTAAEAAAAAPVQSVNGQTGAVSLDASDVGADPAGTASSAVAAHVAAPDPHPQYVTSTEAEAYADAAAASAAAAEAAMDAAQLSAGVYPDTAAGLAATTSGDYFSVPSADSSEYLILYKNDAGSAVEVKRYPSAASISSFKQCSAIYAGNLDTIPSQIASALALAGVSISQDFYSGVVGISASEANPAAVSGTKKTFYVNPVTGNDANSGLTRALAKKSLVALVASSSRTEDTEVIIIGGPHIFYRDQSLAGVTWNKPYHLSIVAEEEAIITSGELPSAMTWTASSTAWQTTRSASKAVYDAGFRDYRGIPRRLARAASVSEVQATPGTWYDDGTTVTVRTHDSRMPDANIIVQLTTGVVKFIPQAGKTVFLKNLKIAQHRSGYANASVEVVAGDTGYFKAINCAFIGGDGNAFESLRTSVCYLRDCTATQGKWDGFNHHDNSTTPQSVVIEVGCHGYKNGAVGGTDYNNSTAHDGLTIVRVNCVHYESYGPSVADVNGCYSFNLNCISGRSYLASGGTAASWYFDNTVRPTPGAAWLIGCAASDSLYDINAQNTSVQVNVRGWRGTPVVGPNAVLTRY